MINLAEYTSHTMISESQRILAMDYDVLKNRFLSEIPDNINIDEIKRNLPTIFSKRRLGRIRNLPELLRRCEEHLLILPETGNIELFLDIVELVRKLNINNVSSSTWEEVRMLTPARSPVDSVPRSCPPPAALVKTTVTPAPQQIVSTLIRKLTGPGTGRDWDHFSLALGTGLDREEDIRLKEGDLCRLERKYGDNLGPLLRHVIREFERKCRQFEVKVDTTLHIQDILRTEWLLYDQTYYNALANELGKERLRLLS